MTSVQTPAEVTPIQQGQPPRQRRNLADLLIIALIAASIIRFIAAIGNGIIYGTLIEAGPTHSQDLGFAVQYASGFGDGDGVLILLVALGLTWWQYEHWSAEVRRSFVFGPTAETLRAQASLRWDRKFAILIAANFLLVAVGAIAFVYGTHLTDSGPLVPFRLGLAAVFGNGGFDLGYVVISLVGAVVGLRLRPMTTPPTDPSEMSRYAGQLQTAQVLNQEKSVPAIQNHGSASAIDPEVWAPPRSGTTEENTSQ